MMLSLLDYNFDGLLCYDQIASNVGLTKQAVRVKSGIDEYFVKEIPNPAGKGRPLRLFKKDALKLWNREMDENDLQTRKPRKDKGKPREISEKTWELAVEMTFKLYINNALDNNCQLACQEACYRLQSQGYSDADAVKIYRRIKLSENRKNPVTGEIKRMEGIFYTDPRGRWDILRKSNLRKNEMALKIMPTLRYEPFRIYESGGIAGQGFGVGKIIVIDDGQRDAWTRTGNHLKLQKGIAFIDALTGYNYLYLPVEQVSANMVAAGILYIATHYGIHGDTVWVMENSKSMKNFNLENLIYNLYSSEEIAAFEKGISWVMKIFNGLKAPIARNIPDIPREFGKARIERHFGTIKREFDATYFATSFQGGNRNETTHLTVSARPILTEDDAILRLPAGMYTPDERTYWEMLNNYLESKYIDRPRPTMLGEWQRTMKDRGVNVNATIRDMQNYYSGGKKDTRRILKVDDLRLATLLYFAMPERQKHRTKLTFPGHYSITIDNVTHEIVHEKLTSNLIGHYLVTIPVPKRNQFFIFLADNIEYPQLLCRCEDFKVRDINDIQPRKRAVIAYRDKMTKQYKEATKEVLAWELPPVTGKIIESGLATDVIEKSDDLEKVKYLMNDTKANNVPNRSELPVFRNTDENTINLLNHAQSLLEA